MPNKRIRYSLKSILLLVVLFGLNHNALADESKVISEALFSAFLPVLFIIVIASGVLAFLLHFLFNRIANKKRKSLWRILTCVILIHISYFWIEIETSFFQSLFSNSWGWVFQYLLPYVMFGFVGALIGFLITPKSLKKS